MVCSRCIMTVKKELESLGHSIIEASLGKVSFISETGSLGVELESKINTLGFSLLENKKMKRSKEVKAMIEKVYSGDFDFPPLFRFSKFVTQALDTDYDELSEAFILFEKKNIEQYIIDFRINKVKELLVYSNYTLADIAFMLNFNSVAHLSKQFKQYTGLTPSFFKEIKKEKAVAAFSEN